MSHSISFGTDGWRAVIADQFTFANVERVAYAAGKYVLKTYYKDGAKPPLLVGYDTRFLADKFAYRVAHVLMSMGVNVKIAERDVPTPVIAFATQMEPTAGALQLTASHNPPEYCGIKYIPDYAGPATNEITDALVSYLDDLPHGYEARPCEVPTFDAKGAYFAALDERIDWERIKKAKLRVCCDTVYSTSRGYLDQLLIDHGVETKAIHNWRDPLFGGGMPEPKPEYLLELMDVVRKEKFNLGIATDGDADRFGVVDDQGVYFSPNQMISLLTRHLVKNHGMKGTVVRSVATSHLVDKLAGMYGLDVIETPVGFKYIGEIMRQKDVLIGAEESGGVSMKGHIPEKDGLFSNMMVVEMLAYEGKPLSAIWEDLLKEANLRLLYARRDLTLTAYTQHGLMERMSNQPFERLGALKVTKVERKDGFKFYIDHNNWTLVRPSGTEPLFRLYFEAESQKNIDEMLNGFTNQAQAIIDELNKQTEKVKA